MTFTNQASESICHAIYAMSSNAEDMRKLKLSEVANRINSEVDGLMLALAICEKTGTITATRMYFEWMYDHEGM